MNEYLFWYLIGINVLAFLAYGYDKLQAKRKARRLSERCLIELAVIGGSVGAMIGMYLFRHKTLHSAFTVGIPAIFIIQVLLAIFFL